MAEEEQSKPTKYCHVAIALGSGKILDAQGGSVRVTTFEILLDDYNHIAVKRTPGHWTAAMQETIQNFAEINIGKNFNCIGMMKVEERKDKLEIQAREKLERFFNGEYAPEGSNREVYFCSQLITCAFIEVGIITPSASIILAPEVLTPSDLAIDGAFGFFQGYITRNPDTLIPEDDHFRSSL